jgi:anti-sigma regulatory factor (Ser/Thr protein kinase)
MTAWPIKHLMIFPNRAEKIYPFLQDVISFIERHIPEKAEQVAFSIRVIITELLTNGIKHSRHEPSGIELNISPDLLIIKKIDNGEPFQLKGPGMEWPLTDKVDNHVTIYADELNGLFAKIIAPYSLSFYAESYPTNDERFLDISEHYGLVIICRASNSFVYQYNPRSQQNIFTATINLD